MSLHAMRIEGYPEPTRELAVASALQRAGRMIKVPDLALIDCVKLDVGSITKNGQTLVVATVTV